MLTEQSGKFLPLKAQDWSAVIPETQRVERELPARGGWTQLATFVSRAESHWFLAKPSSFSSQVWLLWRTSRLFVPSEALGERNGLCYRYSCWKMGRRIQEHCGCRTATTSQHNWRQWWHKTQAPPRLRLGFGQVNGHVLDLTWTAHFTMASVGNINLQLEILLFWKLQRKRDIQLGKSRCWAFLDCVFG